MSHFTDAQRIEQEKKLMRQQDANALKNSGAGRFSSSNTRQPSGDGRLAHRVFHETTDESAARRAEMQKSASSSHPFTPVREVMKSTAIAQLHHNRYADTHGLADFFRLLETNYGAIKGNIPSYEPAMNKYHSDTERIEKENAMRIETERHRSERSASIAQRSQQQQDDFLLSQQEDAARFQHNFRMGHQAKQEEPEEPRGWSSRFQDMFGRAKAYAQGYSSSQQHREESGNSSRRERSRSPPRQSVQPTMLRAQALGIMGFAANATPTSRDLKLAFNREALKYHPDKNMGKSPADIETFRINFEEMQKAFEILKKHVTSDSSRRGGGIIKRRHKRHKTSKKARRNTRRKTRGKTHRKSHRKSNKRR